MIKILVCCASGSGTSMLTKLTTEKACKALGIEATVSHAPISEGKSAARNYDLILTAKNFVNTFNGVSTKVAAVKNPLSVDEIKADLKESGFAD